MKVIAVFLMGVIIVCLGVFWAPKDCAKSSVDIERPHISSAAFPPPNMDKTRAAEKQALESP